MLYNLAYPLLFARTKVHEYRRRASVRRGEIPDELAHISHTPETLFRVACWRLRRADIMLSMIVSPQRVARLSVERFETIRQATIKPSILDAHLEYTEKAFKHGRETVCIRYYGDPSLPQVLVLHGWNGNAGMLGEQVQALLERGFAVVVPDLPGHGKSSGRRFSFYDLGRAVADVLSQETFEAVIGHSAGGLIGLLALQNGLRAHRFIPIGSPASLEAVLQSYVDVAQMPKWSYWFIRRYYTKRYGIGPDAIGPKMLENLPVRSLVVHENNDWQVVVQNAHQLAAAARDAELFLTTGRTHLNILKAPEVHEKIGAFLKAEARPC